MSSKIGVKILLVVLLLNVSSTHPERKAMDDIDVSNDIIIENYEEVKIPERSGKVIKPISEQNNIPQDTNAHFVPAEIIEKTRSSLLSDGYDPFYLNNFQLQVPAKRYKSAQFDEVVLNDGKLFGLSDFHSIDDSKLSDDSFHLWLIWNRLRAIYTVNVNSDGLKDSGAIEVTARRLYMHVQMPLSHSKEPKVEVSKVKDIETKITGIDMTSEELKAAIISDIESKIRNILNTKIRNILINYVKRTFDNNSIDNKLSPFMLSSEIYEIRFNQPS